MRLKQEESLSSSRKFDARRREAVLRHGPPPGIGGARLHQAGAGGVHGERSAGGRIFPNVAWHTAAVEPLKFTQMHDQVEVKAQVKGGGVGGQAGAVRMGLSRALAELNPELRPALRKNGFLTRDSRMKERKKYGQKGARRRFQYSKR